MLARSVQTLVEAVPILVVECNASGQLVVDGQVDSAAELHVTEVTVAHRKVARRAGVELG